MNNCSFDKDSDSAIHVWDIYLQYIYILDWDIYSRYTSNTSTVLVDSTAKVKQM